MKFTVNGIDYTVRFAHEPHVPGDRRRTVCFLRIGGPQPRWAEVGTADCSPRDQFSRAVGRKLAFGRALRRAGLPVETRRELWRQYLARFQPGVKVS